MKMSTSSAKKKKVICHFGDAVPSDCTEGPGPWGQVRTNSCLIKECKLEIDVHMKNLGLWSDLLKECPKATECWLICNRLSAVIGQIVDENSLICPKHRWVYGLGWKPRKVCAYPEHQQTKNKVSSNWQKINPKKSDEIYQLFSSPVKSLLVSVGSPWCNNCRQRIHPIILEKNKEKLTIYPCAVCKQKHENIDFAMSPNTTYTPQKTSQSEVDSNFTPPSSSSLRDSFNESMRGLNPDWTPVQYQLRKSYEDLNEKTQKKLVRKGLSAVSIVFGALAPGQSDTLREACLVPQTKDNTLENLQYAVTHATGSSNKIQLLSVLCTKNEDGSYHHTIQEMIQLFPGTTKHQIEKARKHAAIGKAGMPIETGKYHRIRITSAQISHFLDFMQFSGLVQDVASGTRSIKLSTGGKAIMPNVVRTVHKAEVIRIYVAACDDEGYTKETGRPSTRTIWNILNNCPASQRKSLSGLDNIAAEGSDAFDSITKCLQSVSSLCEDRKQTVKSITDDLIQGKRYLKGDYKAHCADDDGSHIADHCRVFALSDPKIELFQKKCTHNHDLFCDECEHLKDTLEKSQAIINDCESFPTKKEKLTMLYEVSTAITKINTWKAHILATIHQEKQKTDIMASLDDKTAFFVIDFAMKVLPKRYREAMAQWFGKKGNGMHVACAIMRNEKGELFKKTYIVFIGAAPQDVGSVIAIYEATLTQVKTDFPHLKCLIDKSDNAGCYHNEIFFFWKATWPTRVLDLKFTEAMFNERQSGKDQCDRDSATAKTQMRYYIDSGKNIETAAEMNEALRSSTALCGFNSCVLNIDGKGTYKKGTIDNISKIHSMKFIYDEDQVRIRVWQFYGIGEGKVYTVTENPTAPTYSVQIPFESGNVTFGRAKAKSKKNDIFYCPEVSCIETFTSVALLRQHLDLGKHVHGTTNVKQLDKVKDMWVERFMVGSSSSLQRRSQDGSRQEGNREPLDMGWALSKKSNRRLNVRQKAFLNKLFDEGEKTKNKSTAESALKKLKEALDVDDFLPLATIKSYFSRRAKALREGKVTISDDDNDRDEDNDGDDNDDDEDDGDEEDEADASIDEERVNAIKTIETNVAKINLEENSWVAVAFPGTWYPGQCIEHDDETEEVKLHFLRQANSLASNRFVWPELCGKEADKSWVDECDVLYTLPEPTEGTRDTLQFPQDVVDDVQDVYQNWKNK